MDYGCALCLDAHAFFSVVIETYADPDGYLPGAVHLDWFSSIEQHHRCHIVTYSHGTFYLSTTRGRRSCPRFWTALCFHTWLYFYLFHLLSRCSTRAFLPSFDFWIYWTKSEVVVGGHSRRLAPQICASHGIVDVHQDAISWNKPRLPADTKCVTNLIHSSDPMSSA